MHNLKIIKLLSLLRTFDLKMRYLFYSAILKSCYWNVRHPVYYGARSNPEIWHSTCSVYAIESQRFVLPINCFLNTLLRLGVINQNRKGHSNDVKLRDELFDIPERAARTRYVHPKFILKKTQDHWCNFLSKSAAAWEEVVNQVPSGRFISVTNVSTIYEPSWVGTPCRIYGK